VVAAAALLAAPAPLAHARATDGTIASVAGTTPGFAGDGGPATQAQMDTPRDVAFLADGSFVIADFANSRVRRVFGDGRIFTDAGNDQGYSGDGGPAQDADLDRPRGVTTLSDGGYLIADTFNNRIRRVFADGHIATVAGGNGELNHPSDTATLPDGGFVVADTDNDRVVNVAANGTLTTLAGSGTPGFAGDGGPATAAQLSQPRDVAVASDGAILIADTGNDRIRRVAPDGTISTVAGTGAGLAGDGDPAATAKLTTPFSVAALPHGGFLFADTGNQRVRRVTPLGAIFTVAGTDAGDAGDGGPANTAKLNAPGAITNAPGGGFLVADTGNAQIRRVSDIGAVPPAVAGHSVGVAPASGDVTVKPLGMPGYLPLAEEDLVPVQSQVDATSGHIAVTVAQDVGGNQLTAELFDAPFTVQQGSDAQPFTNFRLPPLTGCDTTARTAGAPRATTAAKKKRKKKRRSLWAKESGGRWRSSTGSTSASAVGTFWNTQLLCEGTRIGVFEGVVRVRDKVRKRNHLVKAGESFLVKTSGARRGQ
jgi:hypothetical protein